MGKVAFLFPGQGSQAVGMGRDLFDHGDDIAQLFHQADAALGIPLTEWMFQGPEDRLRQTENTQPSLVLTGLAAFRLVTSRTTLRPDFVAGHSLGEYAAIAAAGGFSPMDAIRLVRVRGEAMRAALPPGEGGMAAVLNLDAAEVENVCREAAEATGQVCAPANFNTAAQIVISGHLAAVERAMALAKAKRARCVMLPVSAPFHCALMAPAARTMSEVLSSQGIADLQVPLVANVTARETLQGETIRAQLVAQVTSPVRWEASMRRLLELGVDTFVELGTGQVLTGMLKRIGQEVRAVAVNGPADLNKLVF
ncbi:MAG: ACP S-malonyltransferase [Magnetococcales bacterium]|nr:ACP S-malonyltransferase [Magnetococcales bacterium]